MASPVDGVDWGRWAALAAVHLGWPPEQFWTATPLEFRRAWAVRFGPPSKPFLRRDLDALLTRYPDERRSCPTFPTR